MHLMMVGETICRNVVLKAINDEDANHSNHQICVGIVIIHRNKTDLL